jgi:hypothetical protein
MPLMKIFFVLPLPGLAGFTACRIRLKLYCIHINTLTILSLTLQNWKQMDKFHNPFMANILLLWIYRRLLQLNNILTENKQIFYSNFKTVWPRIVIDPLWIKSTIPMKLEHSASVGFIHKQIYSKLKYIKISVYVKFKILHQPVTVK